MTIGGIAALLFGGRLTVYAAVKIATAIGVPEFLIGLTIISFGTTLPELITGILATRRGQGDIAMGNVVGSNIFNLLFIGGTVSIIRPIPVKGPQFHLDQCTFPGVNCRSDKLTFRFPHH